MFFLKDGFFVILANCYDICISSHFLVSFVLIIVMLLKQGEHHRQMRVTQMVKHVYQQYVSTEAPSPYRYSRDSICIWDIFGLICR